MEDFFEVCVGAEITPPCASWMHTSQQFRVLGYISLTFFIHDNLLTSMLIIFHCLLFTSFKVVDQHFEIRQRAAEQRKRLEDRAVQFRNIEKRLLMRFKVTAAF